MQFVDTHAHLTFEQYEGKLDHFVTQAAEAGVGRIVTVGTDLLDSLKAVAIAKEYQDVIYAVIGVHPHDAASNSPQDIDDMGRIIEDGSVIAVGETGLDYYYDLSPKAAQQEIFRSHLTLARKYSVPVIIHCRDAFDDCIGIIKEFGPQPEEVIFHCYSGGLKETKELMDLGVIFSFSGTVTFKKSSEIQESAVYLPMDRIMLETDSPYLSPEPKRNVKPNEPALVIHTAAKLAELKGCKLEEIASATTANFERVMLKIS